MRDYRVTCTNGKTCAWSCILKYKCNIENKTRPKIERSYSHKLFEVAKQTKLKQTVQYAGDVS
jgi:hypothetical protein